MPTPNSVRAVARLATRAGDKFTARELLNAGATYYGIAKAIEGGYLKRLKQVDKSGRRGRPAAFLTLTAKGRKAGA